MRPLSFGCFISGDVNVIAVRCVACLGFAERRRVFVEICRLECLTAVLSYLAGWRAGTEEREMMKLALFDGLLVIGW